mgnify:CR=1 FL=1
MNPKLTSDMKQYQKNYYQANRQKLIDYGCNKIQCDLCNRTIARNQMRKHKLTKICKKSQI